MQVDVTVEHAEEVTPQRRSGARSTHRGMLGDRWSSHRSRHDAPRLSHLQGIPHFHEGIATTSSQTVCANWRLTELSQNKDPSDGRKLNIYLLSKKGIRPRASPGGDGFVGSLA